MINQKNVVVSKNALGNTCVTNYDGCNQEVNRFLAKFDLDEHRADVFPSSKSGFAMVFFQCLPEMYAIFNTQSFRAAFERMGVTLVFK